MTLSFMGSGSKGPRISGATCPKGLRSGRGPLENDVLIVELWIRGGLGHPLGPPSLSASLREWAGPSLCPPGDPTLLSCLTFHMARTRSVSNSRPPSTPTSTHQNGMPLSSEARSSCVCTCRQTHAYPQSPGCFPQNPNLRDGDTQPSHLPVSPFGPRTAPPPSCWALTHGKTNGSCRIHLLGTILPYSPELPPWAG